MAYEVKDSGERKEFESGMVRDTSEGKTQYHRIFEGPMYERWATHLTKGAVKYPDLENGSANWTLAAGNEELTRFTQSAVRHFVQWLRGDDDEDHAAAVFFNLNGAEYVKKKIFAKHEAQIIEALTSSDYELVRKHCTCQMGVDSHAYTTYKPAHHLSCLYRALN